MDRVSSALYRHRWLCSCRVNSGENFGILASCSITPQEGEGRQYPYGDDSQGLARCLSFDTAIRSPQTTVKDALGCEFLTFRLAVRSIAFP